MRWWTNEPGWHFYPAAALNQHNPWWLVMPNVTCYLQRISYLLRQGKPAIDVAVLLPTDDAWAQFRATVTGSSVRHGEAPPVGASISVNQIVAARLGTEMIPEILNSGYSFDFTDAEAIDKVGIPYPLPVLPDIERLPLVTYRKIEAYAQAGGILIATRNVPSIAPGLKQFEAESPQVQRISRQLFREPAARGHFLAKDADLGARLTQVAKPDVLFSPPVPGLGFVHRKLPSADLYFVANTTNQVIHTQATFRVTATRAELWDPVSGTMRTMGGAFRGLIWRSSLTNPVFSCFLRIEGLNFWPGSNWKSLNQFPNEVSVAVKSLLPGIRHRRAFRGRISRDDSAIEGGLPNLEVIPVNGSEDGHIRVCCILGLYY
jgi:alpha-L-rhamnosidase